jgi:dihydrofolate reductase
MSAARLEMVAAVSKNGVIGRSGGLPWHLPDDLKHFKNLTIGHPVIMGRRTFESCGKPLPGRRNIIVSTTAGDIPGAEVVRDLDAAMGLLANTAGPAYIVGGSVLYAAALPRADAMQLTEIDADVEGDTFFPPFDKSQWKITRETWHPPDDRHAFGFHIRSYERVK